MEQDIVETRYPLYDEEMTTLISKVRTAHRGKTDVDARIAEAVWTEHRHAFRDWVIEASRGDASSLAAAERGELTSTGRAVILRYFDEVKEYIGSTADLSDAELVARHNAVCGVAEATRLAQRRVKGERADVLAFFNRASARADFQHWRALPVWSAEEATALSLGKDPRRVNVTTLRAYTCLHGSPFRDDFMARLEALERAIKAGGLKEPLTPKKYRQWAAKYGTAIPKIMYDDDANLEQPSNNCNDIDNHIHGGRLHTFYKVVLGMAVKHYGFDVTLEPNAIQSKVYSLLSEDLLSMNVHVNTKTLRKIVREALNWARDHQQPIVEHAMRKKSRERGSSGMHQQK